VCNSSRLPSSANKSEPEQAFAQDVKYNIIAKIDSQRCGIHNLFAGFEYDLVSFLRLLSLGLKHIF
jgi:hypothetical protein